MPMKPSASPQRSAVPGHCPLYRPPNSAAHSGMLPTTSAATPEGTHCWAYATHPLPTPSSSRPVKAPAIHWRKVGAGMPRSRSTA